MIGTFVSLASLMEYRLWFSLPLIIVISLVYGATRHEQLVPILKRSAGFSLWIIGFMVLIFVMIRLLTWGL